MIRISDAIRKPAASASGKYRRAAVPKYIEYVCVYVYCTYNVRITLLSIDHPHFT